MNEAAYFAVWLVGMFSIVGVVCACVAKLVIRDSTSYDEPFVWKRKLPEETNRNAKGGPL